MSCWVPAAKRWEQNSQPDCSGHDDGVNAAVYYPGEATVTLGGSLKMELQEFIL